MSYRNFPGQKTKRPIQASMLNGLRQAVENLTRMKVGPGLVLKWAGGIPVLAATGRIDLRWFYTTGVVSAAVIVGTTAANSTLTYGSGPARPCTRSLVASKQTLTPPASGADTTIYNGLNSPGIAANQFALCGLVDGLWVVILVPC